MWPLLHWLAIHIGAENESGVYYGFWSGFGSDLGEVAIVTGIVSLYRHHNCHVKGCPRLAKYEVLGTPYKVCLKHHPAIDEKPTAEVVKETHKAVSNGRCKHDSHSSS